MTQDHCFLFHVFFFILCPSFLRFGQGPSLSEKPLTVKEVLPFFNVFVEASVRSLAGLCWEQVGCEFQRFDWNRPGFQLALLPAEFPQLLKTVRFQHPQ